MSASSFSRSFTASSTVAMISLLGSVLEVIEKLRPFDHDYIIYKILVMLKITRILKQLFLKKTINFFYNV